MSGDIMKNVSDNAEEILNRYISGFHQYILKKPVHLSYVSDNLCDLIGYTQKELLSDKADIYAALVHPADARLYSDFLKKLLSEEKTLTAHYRLLKKDGTLIYVNDTASFGKLSDGTPVAYSVLTDITSVKNAREQPVKPISGTITTLAPNPAPMRKIYIRTFGYFDVFVNDNPIAFRNQKSKELLALIVDRRGGYVSSEEAISYLWENEPINQVTMARYRKVAMRLKIILEEYGISDIIRTVNGKRCIAVDKVRCDLYNYLSGEEKYSQLFKGSYLTNYSWGEMTLAELQMHST